MRPAALAAALAVVSVAAAERAELARLPIGGVQQHHRFYAKSGRIAYVEGEYPRKTYLGLYELATGRSRRVRVPDHRLSGRHVLLEERDLALVEAVYRPEEADETRLLLVRLSDGGVERQIPVVDGARVVVLARPAWSGDVFIVMTARGRTFLKSLDAASGVAGEARELGAFEAAGAAFDERRPLAALSVLSGGRARLVVCDLAAGAVTGDLPPVEGFAELLPAESGVLARAEPPDASRGRLFRLDLEARRAVEVAAVDGAIESVLEAGGRLFVLAKDFGRPPEPNDRGYHPRLLTVFGAPGGRPAERMSWTKRSGRLFGLDGSGRLLFAATQPMSTWTLGTSASAVAGAAAELDRRAGEFWRSDGEAWILVLTAIGIVAVGALVWLLRPYCKRCG